MYIIHTTIHPAPPPQPTNLPLVVVDFVGLAAAAAAVSCKVISHSLMKLLQILNAGNKQPVTSPCFTH